MAQTRTETLLRLRAAHYALARTPPPWEEKWTNSLDRGGGVEAEHEESQEVASEAAHQLPERLEVPPSAMRRFVTPLLLAELVLGERDRERERERDRLS